MFNENGETHTFLFSFKNQLKTSKWRDANKPKKLTNLWMYAVITIVILMESWKAGQGLSKYCDIFKTILSIKGPNTTSHPWGSLASKSNKLLIEQIAFYSTGRQVRVNPIRELCQTKASKGFWKKKKKKKKGNSNTIVASFKLINRPQQTFAYITIRPCHVYCQWTHDINYAHIWQSLECHMGVSYICNLSSVSTEGLISANAPFRSSVNVNYR